jgi:hypothetical protein
VLLEDVIKRVKELFGDESDAQLSSSTIVRWVNDSYREAALQNIGVKEKKSSHDLVAGTQTLALSSDVVVLHRVKIRTSPTTPHWEIKGWSTPDFEAVYPGWEGDTSRGTPVAWMERERILHFFPLPDVSVTGGILLEYSSYTSQHPDSDSEGPLHLPEYYHNYIVDYCMMKAYEMDEDYPAMQYKAQAVQATLDFTEGRENWMNQATYPVVRDYLADNWD